jgi:fumarate reductase subunit D
MSQPRPAYLHALLWALFAAGGMVAAVLLPAHILIQGVLGPLGVVPYLDGNYGAFSAVMANPLAKLYFVVLVSLPLFHAAHRFHFWLHHLGVQLSRRPVQLASYGIATALALAAVYVALTTP